jgi:hypothetical protein
VFNCLGPDRPHVSIRRTRQSGAELNRKRQRALNIAHK